MAVVLPLRSFADGKSRLGLLPTERVFLVRRMAEAVVAAAGPLPVAVVSAAPEVCRWARSLGLTVLSDPGSLDGAAMLGARWAAATGAARVIVAHGDLPRARTLAPVMRDNARPIVTAVPCHRNDGTPVLSVPTACGFRFSYGPGSYRRHAAEARRLGLGFRAIHDPELSFDVDVPEDLGRLAEATASRS